MLHETHMLASANRYGVSSLTQLRAMLVCDRIGEGAVVPAYGQRTVTVVHLYAPVYCTAGMRDTIPKGPG